MLPQETIRRKRDGEALDAAEIRSFVDGLVDGRITEAQAAAFSMAVFFRGMEAPEAAALTLAMRDSGQVLSWKALELPGPTLDKHSTGGVGDKVSLMLAPMIAACGGFVPMISGRGLGHTGGTLDKLDAISGYRSQPDIETFQKTVREVGCAIVGQTDDLAPADRRLYAIRDVTATVESIPLITASILSKKLAAGLDGLVMDVKTGNGAFAAELQSARALADSIVAVARDAGLSAAALITDMNQVLGYTAGNALEVREVVEYLTGAVPEPRLDEVVLALGAEMLCVGGLCPDVVTARDQLVAALDSGDAAERFARMVRALGGPADVIEGIDRHLPQAPLSEPVYAPRPGVVQSVDTRAVGIAVVELGGGRRRVSDPVDHAVGLSSVRGIGDAVDAQRPLAMIHARTPSAWEAAAKAVVNAYRLGDASPTRGPTVLERVERR